MIESQNSISTACGSEAGAIGSPSPSESDGISASTSGDEVAAGLDRSSGPPAQNEPVDADGLRYILDGLLAEIFEFKRLLFHDVIVNTARDADTAGLCQPL